MCTGDRFHLGTLLFSPRGGELAGNAAATLTLAMTILPVIDAGAWVATLLVSDNTLLALQKAVLVALSSGISLATLMIVVTFSATYLAYRFGLDPGNMVIPAVTNPCDVLGVTVLFGVAQMLI